MLKMLDKIRALRAEYDKVIMGYDHVKDLALMAQLADQHFILEGLPGTGKSLFAEVQQGAIEGAVARRVQMSADMKPADLVGVKVYHGSSEKFHVEPGPFIGAHTILVDEINRAPGKTLSSVLSAMQERRITIDKEVFQMPKPFLVIATQNPIEQEGVYPLPEAAVDRFGMKVDVPIASKEAQLAVLNNDLLDNPDPHLAVKKVIHAEELAALQKALKKQIYVSPAALDYIVRLVRSTYTTTEEYAEAKTQLPELEQVLVGCHVRAQMALRALARARAYMQNRTFVLPDDIKELAVPVMRHRLILTDEAKFDAQEEGTVAGAVDELIRKLTEVVPFSDKKSDYTPKKD